MNSDSSNVFTAAVGWLDDTLLGTMAITVAVIAVACVGLLLMTGRVDLRRAAQVILGCFILFGASSIAAGIVQVAYGGGVSQEIMSPPPPVVPTAAPKQAVQGVPYDPYAGAALPSRR